VTAHTFTRVRPTRRTFENTYRNTYGLLLIRHPCTRIYLSGFWTSRCLCPEGNKSALEIDDGGDLIPNHRRGSSQGTDSSLLAVIVLWPVGDLSAQEEMF
jgi:hypothetical protein